MFKYISQNKYYDFSFHKSKQTATKWKPIEFIVFLCNSKLNHAVHRIGIHSMPMFTIKHTHVAVYKQNNMGTAIPSRLNKFNVLFN